MILNTEIFREAAIHRDKYGRYEDGDFRTYEWFDYWKQEHDRVHNGYSVGGVRITGKHYLYLNYLQIPRPKIVKENSPMQAGGSKTKSIHTKQRGKRSVDAPAFWDEDFVIFHTWDIAANGIDLDSLHKLQSYVDIPIVETETNLSGGHHHLWLKPRGVGASWKGATIPIFNQFFEADNSTFIVADQKQYLLKDGLYGKYLDYRNQLIKYGDVTDPKMVNGFSRQFSLMGTKDMEYRCSSWMHDANNNRIEGGQKTSVYGLIIDGVPDNIRGKRGDIIYEEFGSFPNVDKTWEVAQSSVEEDGVVYASMYGFGTGGDTGTGIESLTKMFYDPIPYNILQFKNKWDEHFFEEPCSYFTTAKKSLRFKDKDGNSDQDTATIFLQKIRDDKEAGADPTLLPAFKAEKPFTPQEALLNSVGNIFPITLLDAHLKYLFSSKIHREVVSYGYMSRIGTEAQFFPDFNALPYEKQGESIIVKGAVSVLHKPFKIGSKVPENLYRLSVDPYRHDTSTGDSVGSIYVIENENSLTPYKGDKIVAWYAGRPETQDEFNNTLFAMALYYNAKIAIENDEPGDIISYAKIHKLTYLLEQQFELAYDETIKTKSGMKRKFGMHIASGEDDLRKKQGDKYIQEWLLRVRGVDENGKQILNLHTIFDIGLLQELIKYKKGNFDRISSLRINMFYEREFAYSNRHIRTTPKKKDAFFTKRLYGNG
jgi:hypothetical protein